MSTLDPSGRANYAPMGVAWAEDELILRPFRSTHTYLNLTATGYAVVNLIDDAGVFVDTALGDVSLPGFPAVIVPGVVLTGACYWREVKLIGAGGSTQRADLHCEVVYRGRQRDFLGFSRARAAVIEAAILATRLHLFDHGEVLTALEQFEVIVRKTGDAAELAALQRVREYTKDWFDEGPR